MAYITANHAHVSQVSVLDRIARFIAEQRKAYADHRLYMRTMRELRSLSNHELADLGLCRSSLHDVAYKAVYG